jgi:hypothetical protein
MLRTIMLGTLIGIATAAVVLFRTCNFDSQRSEDTYDSELDEFESDMEEEALPEPSPDSTDPASDQLLRLQEQEEHGTGPVATDLQQRMVRTESKQLTDHGVYNSPTNTWIARYDSGRWVTQGDILVDEKNLLAGVGDEQASLVQIENVDYWSEGRIPFEIDPALESGNVHAAIEEFHRRTAVRFVERTNEPDYVVFRRAEPENDICQSYLGKRGGEQEIVIHPTCSKGHIIHELMHTLGFVHEHSREDRDQFIA